jgi:4-hydroxy-tetrahydrodipicolinate synthase
MRGADRRSSAQPSETSLEETTMARFKDYRPEGVIPAALLPFHEDLGIDEPSFRKHLQGLAAVRGITALTINAHATEVASCTFDEQVRVLDVAAEEVGDRVPLVNGVYADGSLEAARIAKMAEAGGASALLVFPPNTLIAGGNLRPEMALAHFKRIADATDLPLIAFQYPATNGQGYPYETLLRLIDEVPSLVAIKDWCADPMRHEQHVRSLQNLARPFTVLSTHSAWLMSSLVMGCRGLLSGAGSIVADLHVALFEAVQAGDLPRAQKVNDRLYPLQQAFYAPPFLDMHNRMKEGLVLLGRLPRAVVRPPLVKLPPAEIERLRKALAEARLGREGALAEAA